jgi:hypothetical protein
VANVKEKGRKGKDRKKGERKIKEMGSKQNAK